MCLFHEENMFDRSDEIFMHVQKAKHTITEESKSLVINWMRKKRSPKSWKEGGIFGFFSGLIYSQLQGIVKNDERSDQRFGEGSPCGDWVLFRRLLSCQPYGKTSMSNWPDMMLSEVLPTIPEESTSSDMRSDIPAIQVTTIPKKDVDVCVPPPSKR